MKKCLHLTLLLLAFAGFAKAQGPASTANWFGYILPPSPADYKYISFTMQDLGSVSVASDYHPAVYTATFADGYVWSVNAHNGYSICRSRFDAAHNLIEAPEIMVTGDSYITDMAYNPADGRIYLITGEHLKSFAPASPSNMQDHGLIEHDGFNLAINMNGDAYMISSWGEFGSLNLSNAQLTIINSIDLPIKMSFDMLTGELFGVHYGNLYQLDPNTGTYTLLGALNDGGQGYDPTCLFMTYGSSNPENFTVGDLNYRVNDDQVSVTVIGHVDGYNAQGALIIPESVSYGGHNYAVTVIGNTAFMYCFYLTSLSLPNSVTTIEEGAFAYCSGFTGDLVIPNSVITIEPSAFQICYGFESLTLGNSVTTIGDYAFNSCDGLTGILNIPSNVESLGGNTFGYCKFDGIVVDPENPNYDSRNDCNAIITTSTNELITGCKNTVIPNTVTAIGDNAFKGITGMTSIEIPDSVVSIGDNAFALCFDLTGDLTIPNSVTHIGESAFFQCEGLDGTLTLGESVSYIGDWAFRKCSHISEAVSLATTPAMLGDDFGCQVFAEFGVQTLTVPCECSDAYLNSRWYDPIGMVGFYEFVENCSAISEVEPIVAAVYPNPTCGKVRIEAESIQSINIFNLLGEKVFEASANSDAFEYDFSKQSAGVYLIKVETAKGVETARVTVR